MAMVGSNTYGKRLVRLHIPLALYAVFLGFPFLWMLLVSLRPDQILLDTSVNPFSITQITFDHYSYLFEETEFLRWIWNTSIVTVAATFVSLLCSILIGYALGRFNFRGGNLLGVGIFLAYLVPPTLLFIPLSQVVARFNIYNEYWALIFTYPTFLIPFAGWLLMGYFRTIPIELEECALIDGASRWQILTKIVLPLSVPGLISAGIFAFTLSWNEFIYALTFIQSSENKTVPVGVLTELVRSDVYEWGALMAGALIGSLPVVILYSFFVEHYVSSMTGAVKE